jgi:hypothetical protein
MAANPAVRAALTRNSADHPGAKGENGGAAIL